ncbi:1,4-beta-glucanase, partial [Kineococcus sp. R8]|uniref:glycoside hydrolase family 6 protein n=1 Tax=Kineococcus siccus TaxID=2696567 RepID=UPI001412185E
APRPAPAPAPAPANPLAGARFWVDPASNARREADRRAADPAARAALLRIAEQPGAEWIGDWTPTSAVAGRVAAVVAAGRSAGTVPVLVLYAIPHRDCGSYSRGGLPDTAAYAAWVRQVRAGLGTGRAVVVLEPDALPQLDCLPGDADRRARTAALRDAVGVLAGAPGAVVYLDAGTSRWVPADAMAQRLRDAGVAQARGFSLNVSNFGWTDAEAAYGDQLVARLPGSHYVVDTSRNGRGPGDTWCNPAGRALGPVPTSSTGRAAADAYLWVKRVGESDGDCGRGEPAAGTWWPDYAIGLSQRAGG